MWWNRTNKTQRIGALETSIARLASEIVNLRKVADRTQEGVEDIQSTLNANHVAHARCETTQDGRWEAHTASHQSLDEDLTELTALVKQNAENIRILSANVSRIADRQRGS